jgi:hypothetical protein
LKRARQEHHESTVLLNRARLEYGQAANHNLAREGLIADRTPESAKAEFAGCLMAVDLVIMKGIHEVSVPC